MDEIVFVVSEDESGGYNARAVGHGIFTEADNLDELKAMIEDAIDAYFFDSPSKPRSYTISYQNIPVPAR